MTLYEQLSSLAARYETRAFLLSDPSRFMHDYLGVAPERAAFVAAALSYGRREQFMPKIASLLQSYLLDHTPLPDDDACFYRLHTNRMVNHFLATVDGIYSGYGSMKALLVAHDVHSGKGALQLLTQYFAAHDASALVPRDVRSACKRLCLFLRWMVRDGSAVDLGLWSDIIDKSTLIIPLDTHVLRQARRLGLLTSGSATLAVAERLTARLRELFPADPLRADFALFGMGVEGVAPAPLCP